MHKGSTVFSCVGLTARSASSFPLAAPRVPSRSEVPQFRGGLAVATDRALHDSPGLRCAIRPEIDVRQHQEGIAHHEMRVAGLADRRSDHGGTD